MLHDPEPPSASNAWAALIGKLFPEVAPALLDKILILGRLQEEHVRANPHTAKGKAQANGARRKAGKLVPESGTRFAELVAAEAKKRGYSGWSRTNVDRLLSYGRRVLCHAEVLAALRQRDSVTSTLLDKLAGLADAEEMMWYLQQPEPELPQQDDDLHPLFSQFKQLWEGTVVERVRLEDGPIIIAFVKGQLAPGRDEEPEP